MDNTAWKGSIFGVILVHIFPNSDWIGRDTLYISTFGSTDQKYGSKQL